jgi:hypothetical protein
MKQAETVTSWKVQSATAKTHADKIILERDPAGAIERPQGDFPIGILNVDWT